MAYTEPNALSHHIDAGRHAALMLESDTECLTKVLRDTVLPIKQILDAENVGSDEHSIVQRVETLVILWKSAAQLYEEALTGV